jgi:hypothetical protein
METLLALAVVVIIIGILLAVSKAARRRGRNEDYQRNLQQQYAHRQEQIARGRAATHSRRNRVYKQLQLALLTLNQVPDFQRAASWAQHAQDIPLQLRQRLFHRFRTRMVAHMCNRMSAGGNARQLLTSLTTLVQSLGVAAFEAQYIQTEAFERQGASDEAPPSFDEQLRELRQKHEARVSALRSLGGVDPETKEQLIETEQTRFREAVLALGDSPESE